MAGGFTVYNVLPKLESLVESLGMDLSNPAHADTHHIWSAGLVAVGLMSAGIVWGSAQKKAGTDAIVPEPTLTTRNVGDVIAEALDNFVLSVVGPQGRKYTPIFGTIFLFIFLNNVLGLIPGFLPATDKISTNVAIAIVVFVMTHVIGIKTHGAAYAKHFLGPMLALAPLMLPIELISHIARPASLSIRLFGNMYGDHMVLGIFSNLAPLVIPVVFLFLGLFVCLMQAFVFTMLSMLYIAGAESHDH